MPGQGTGTAAHPYGLYIGSVDVIAPAGLKGAVPLESIRTTDNGHNGPSTMEFLHEDPTKAFALPAGAEVQFKDFRTNETIFGGYLVSREIEPFPGQQGRVVRCRCTDYSVHLDRRVLGPSWSSGSVINAQTILESVLPYMGVPLTLSLTGTSGSVGTQIFAGIPARSIIEQILTQLSGIWGYEFIYFVSPYKVLYAHGVNQFGFAPPTNITDVSPVLAAKELTLEYDESGIINAVYVRGASKTASGWVNDAASQATYGVRQGVIDEPRATTLLSAQRYGTGYLVSHKNAVLRGSFKVDGNYCYTAGKHWRAEMNVVITNSALSLSAFSTKTFRVDTAWQGGAGAHEHLVNFGGLPRSGVARIIRALTSAGVGIMGTAALPTSGQRIVGSIG